MPSQNGRACKPSAPQFADARKRDFAKTSQRAGDEGQCSSNRESDVYIPKLNNFFLFLLTVLSVFVSF